MISCQACGRDSAADARFCAQCGARLDGTGVPVIAAETRSAVMSELRGEERLVTAVFADMTESVRRTSGLTPEAATQLVNPLLETMVELMQRYGGRIDRFLGDGVLAVFGVPAAHEDDPYRAVRASLDLRDRAADLGLAVTVGVNTGRVYFGPVGSSLHEELTVMGPVVNLAARFQGAAAAGEIVVGSSTAAHLAASFQLAPTTLTIKGISEPVEAFKASRVLDHPDKVRGIEGLRAEMIGRDRELRELRSVFPAGGVIALVAPAGVGKSRLAGEYRTEVTSSGGQWLEGRCLELTEGVSYAPFVDLLVRLLGAGEQAEAVVASVERLVTAGGLTAERGEEILPYLVHLLGGELGDRRDLRVTEASDDLRRTLTIDGILAYLTAHSRMQPTVVCLEDVHWSDPLSRETIRALGVTAPDGLLVLVTHRPDMDTAELGAGVRQILLSELSPEDGRRLVSALLNVSGLPPWLESRIVDDAAGNPFYVEELIRSLIQRGAITHQNGEWQVTTDGVDLDLPESVEGVLMSRFDRLADPTRRAARAASVLDPDFDARLLAELGGDGLGPELDTLVRAGILVIIPGEPTRYAFSHALGRQAIYSSLLPSQRAELHEHAARSLESGGDADRIAYHYAHSRNHPKAVEWLLRAGERALETFASDAARTHLEAGLARIEELAEPERAAWRGRYQLQLGELLGRMAKYGEARLALESALAEMDPDPMGEARIWRLLGQNHRLDRDVDTAHQCYDRAEQILDSMPGSDDRPARQEWIRVQKERAFALYFGGRGGELPAHNARVGPVAEQHGTDAQLADHLYGEVLSSFVAYRFVVPESTVATARRALELAERGADPGRVAEGRFVYGFSLLWADQVEEAAEVLTRAVEETTRLGTVTEGCRAKVYRAIALRRLGAVDAAEEAAIEAREAAAAIDSEYYTGHALAVLCWAAWKRGDEDADRIGEEAYRAWGVFERDGDRGLDTEFAWLAVWPRAEDAFDREDFAAAVDHLRHVLVSWERPMPAGLAEVVRRAVESGDPELLAESIRGAEAAGLL